MATGLGGFAFIVVATNSLGLEAFAPVSQLWTIWALAAAVITFSYQQLTIRRAWQTSGPVSPSVIALPFVLALAVLVIGIATSTRIFGSDTLWWPAAAAGMPIGAALIGVAKGRWAARGRYLGLATLVASENGIRAVLAVIIAILGGSAGWYSLAILLGFSAAAFSPRDPAPARRGSIDESSGSMIGGAGLAGLLAHSTLVAPPLLAAGLGRSDQEVSILFAYLAALRVPYQIALGVVPRAAERWTQASVDDDHAMFAQIKSLLVVIALAGGALAAAMSAAVGDHLAGLLFDGSGVLTSSARAMAAAAVVVAVANLGLTVAGISDGRAGSVAARWAAGVAVSTAAVMLSGRSDTTAILTGMMGVELVVLFLLWSMHQSRRADHV